MQWTGTTEAKCGLLAPVNAKCSQGSGMSGLSAADVLCCGDKSYTMCEQTELFGLF